MDACEKKMAKNRNLCFANVVREEALLMYSTLMITNDANSALLKQHASFSNFNNSFWDNCGCCWKIVDFCIQTNVGQMTLNVRDFCPFTKINYYCIIGVEKQQQHQIYFQVRANHVIKWDWISVRRKQTYFSIRCFVHGLHCNGYIEVRSTKAKINKYSFILFMRL